VAGFERLVGADHPDTLWARRNLVQNLENQKRLPEAEAMQREILEASRRILGPDHVDTRWGESILARILAEEKRYDEAEALYQGSLEGLRRSVGPDHLRTLNAMLNMANLVYVPRGDSAKAEPLLRDIYEAATRIHRDNDRVNAAYSLGCVKAVQGDRRAALDWLRKSVEAGYSDAAYMSEDPDLASLHGDAEFDRLLAAARSKATPPQP
jgi:tetratricopeptide (TPR) repeat protein